MQDGEKKFIIFNLYLKKDGFERAEYLRKKKVFQRFGENCYWHPRIIPSEPYLVAIHNNVNVAANVSFITHDIICYMLNNSSLCKYEDKFNMRFGKIEVYENCFIGANSIIMYNVKIGPNAIVGAGSVVTHDVLPGTIVAGNPAREVGKVDSFVEKMKLYNKKQWPYLESIEDRKKYFWKD